MLLQNYVDKLITNEEKVLYFISNSGGNPLNLMEAHGDEVL